jgi:hypothetical protein
MKGLQRMKPVKEIGLKITAAQREYFRYTGASAELERRGAGSSRPELAWLLRSKRVADEVHTKPGASDANASSHLP